VRDKILSLIIEAANELNQQLENKIPIDRGADAPLYGQDGVLDSLGLVSLVVSVEQAIEDQNGARITLADESAMSQNRSPFRTIGSLAEYAERLIQKGV